MKKFTIFALVKLFLVITLLSVSEEYRQRNTAKTAVVGRQDGVDIVDREANEEFRGESTIKSISLPNVSEISRRDIATENQNATEQSVVCEVPSLSCRNCCEGSKRNCTHKTKFCRCDPQCTFYNDCCVDYETFCGTKQQFYFGVDQEGLSCIQARDVDLRTESERVWMVTKCPNKWKIDEISQNCEFNNMTTFDITNLQKMIPVFDRANNITFRNEFCAKCNGIVDFEYFDFKIKCYVAPPASIRSFDQLTEFASKYCDVKESLSIFRQANQPIRDCNQYFRNVCPTLKDLNRRYNYSCDSPTECIAKRWCDLKLSKWDDTAGMICDPGGGPPGPGPVLSISVAFRLSKFGTVSEVQKPECHYDGKFYDPSLGMCRIGHFVSREVKQSLDKFDVVIWFDVQGISITLVPTLNETISSLGQLFNFKRSQVSALQDIPTSYDETPIYRVIRFELQLSNEQTLSLGKANQTRDVMSKILPLQKLLFFSEQFNFTVSKQYVISANSTEKNITTLTVFKTTSRQLSCVGKKTYAKGNYTVMQNGEYYYINSTGKSFPRNQVFFEGEMNDSISVCELVVFASCVGRRVNLTSDEYVKFDNLSIFYKRTETIYDFGEYDIEDGQIFMCIPEVKTKIFHWIPSDSSIIESYLTLTGFILSLTCLFFVILTFLLFPELRNLPGKNILSLSISLFLVQLLWLIPDWSYPSTLCQIFAVVKHYLFLVSFVVMATIALDTYVVLGRMRARTDSSTKTRGNKKFCKYSAIAWGLPAMFVITCAVVDQKDIYAVYVNELLCWFDNVRAQEYLFVLPVGLLLLFNVALFTLTVIRIHRIRSTTRLVRSGQNDKKMFWIYLKLSTLMGFSWLFGFIDLLVENAVFSYLFVIFASLQGVYIFLAFVVKKDVWEKYKIFFGIRRSEYKPDYRTTLVEKLNHSKETKV